jgi:hypothetical protein
MLAKIKTSFHEGDSFEAPSSNTGRLLVKGPDQITLVFQKKKSLDKLLIHISKRYTVDEYSICQNVRCSQMAVELATRFTKTSVPIPTSIQPPHPRLQLEKKHARVWHYLKAVWHPFSNIGPPSR